MKSIPIHGSDMAVATTAEEREILFETWNRVKHWNVTRFMRCNKITTQYNNNSKQRKHETFLSKKYVCCCNFFVVVAFLEKWIKEKIYISTFNVNLSGCGSTNNGIFNDFLTHTHMQKRHVTNTLPKLIFWMQETSIEFIGCYLYTVDVTAIVCRVGSCHVMWV